MTQRSKDIQQKRLPILIENESRTKYFIDEDELERLNSRISHGDIFKQIQNANRNLDDGEMRLQHCCYVQAVGKIPDYQSKPSSKDF